MTVSSPTKHDNNGRLREFRRRQLIGNAVERFKCNLRLAIIGHQPMLILYGKFYAALPGPAIQLKTRANLSVDILLLKLSQNAILVDLLSTD